MNKKQAPYALIVAIALAISIIAYNTHSSTANSVMACLNATRCTCTYNVRCVNATHSKHSTKYAFNAHEIPYFIDTNITVYA